jgi:hypothetical protein
MNALIEEARGEATDLRAGHVATQYPTHCDKCSERMPCDSVQQADLFSRLADALAEAKQDTARLDWLELEYEREQSAIAERRPYPWALFRQSKPITRAAIDAARRGAQEEGTDHAR